jgi:hypothetical protein
MIISVSLRDSEAVRILGCTYNVAFRLIISLNSIMFLSKEVNCDGIMTSRLKFMNTSPELVISLIVGFNSKLILDLSLTTFLGRTTFPFKSVIA